MAIREETIVTRYEVVTVQHEQGIDRIRQKQKQLELQLKDWRDAANETAKVNEAAWKKVGLGVAAVGVAIVGAAKSYQHYAKEQRLATAAGAVDIDRLSKAAGGLQTRMELLAFAAKTNTATFKLSTDQMVVAQEAIRQLVREGHDQEEVTKKVTDALVKLEGDGLKDFGIRVREAKTDGERFSAVLEALATKARQGDGAVRTEAEAVASIGVRFEDAANRIKTSIGQVVVSMTPLIEQVAKLAEGAGGLVGTIANGWDMIMSAGQYLATGDESVRQQLFLRLGGDPNDLTEKTSDRFENYAAGGGSASDFISGEMRDSFSGEAAGGGMWGSRASSGTNIAGAIGKGIAAFNMLAYRGGTILGTKLGDAQKRGQRGQELAKTRREELLRLSNEEAKRLGDDLLQRLESEPREGITSFGDIAGQPDSRAMLDSFYARGGGLDQQRSQAYGSFNASRSRSRLEEMFGPIDDFNAYAAAFGVLQGAVQSSFGAWIEGSMSAGAAVKKFFAESLKGIAVDLAGRAIYHGVIALGSLAFGDVAGAAKHGATAAKAAAGAAAVGGLAKMLNGSGAPSAGAQSAGGGAASGGGATPIPRDHRSAPNPHNIIIIGDQLSDDSARARGIKARRMVESVYGTSAGDYR